MCVLIKCSYKSCGILGIFMLTFHDKSQQTTLWLQWAKHTAVTMTNYGKEKLFDNVRYILRNLPIHGNVKMQSFVISSTILISTNYMIPSVTPHLLWCASLFI